MKYYLSLLSIFRFFFNIDFSYFLDSLNFKKLSIEFLNNHIFIKYLNLKGVLLDPTEDFLCDPRPIFTSKLMPGSRMVF